MTILEGLVSEVFDVARESESGEVGDAFERGLANVSQGAWEGDVGESPGSQEGFLGDCGDSLRDIECSFAGRWIIEEFGLVLVEKDVVDGGKGRVLGIDFKMGQFGTSGKLVAAKVVGIPAKGDAGQLVASLEEAVCQGCDTVRDGDFGEGIAIVKGVRSDGGDGPGDDEAFQSGAAAEGVGLDAQETLRKSEGGDFTTAEKEFPLEDSDSSGKVDGFQGRAIAEG